MPFNKNISGIKNEMEFVYYLNNRKVNQLNPMFENLISNIFYDVEGESVIRCTKNNLPQKTDIFIEINSIIRRISIKKGVKNSVHVEGITDFISFLISNGVDRNNVIEYLRYQYADGSTNGKGAKRLSAEEYRVANQSKIDNINRCFSNPKIIKKAIKRFVIKGRNDNNEIDVLIYGIVDDFIWIKKEDIYRVIIDNKNIHSNGVHFGSLYCQPLFRCLNRNPLYEKKRYCVQIKWYQVSDDIIKNMNDRYL